jgi:hypothetical protein
MTRLILIIIATAIVAFAACKAFAQPLEPFELEYDDPMAQIEFEADDIGGWLHFDNAHINVLQHHLEATIDTPFGPLGIILHTTPNVGLGCCPDIIEVVSIPDGYMATPHQIVVVEGESGSIRIAPFMGM